MFEGILHFSCGAQRNIFDYGSRVGRLPSYSSILDSLSTLADSEEEKLKAIGRDPTKALIWVGDNVQTGHKKREARFGRHSTMEVGTAATAIVARDFTPALHNTASHIKPIQEEFNMRQNLDVNRLRSLLDYEHIRTVGSLQFVRVLVNYIPQLKPLKSGVAVRYRQDTAKVPPPENWKTELYPLGTTNKNEANTGELKDAVVDFLEQMGMDEESVDAQPQKRILFGGDGLTYEKLLQMKKFLQLHSTEYQRLDIIQPFLQLWHTEWHDLCRIYETHLGETGNKDPSTLGHNSNVISQPLPSNPKKVDYYPAAHTTYTILDARILDCWRSVLITNFCPMLIHSPWMYLCRTFFGANNIFEYFNSLPDEGLPTIDDLVQKAEILFDVYCTPKSHDYYMTGGSGGREPGSSGWSVPHGTHWDKPNEIPEEPVKSKGPGKRRQKMREKGKENVDAKPLDNKLMKEEEPPFDGDASLGRSIMFMYDNIISREVAYAVAEGDAGRVYEGIKVSSWLACHCPDALTK